MSSRFLKAFKQSSRLRKLWNSHVFPGSEDFSYYLEKVPGLFFNIGCKPKGVERAYMNHHPKFDIDEDALLIAAKSVAEIVCSYCEID